MMQPQQTDWDVELKVEKSAQTIKFTVEGQLLMGRTPNGQAEMPSIDLTAFNGVDLGVSRRHGIMVNNGATLSYHDLGGGNGSQVNEVTLVPREPVVLKTGDRLSLGHMVGTLTIKAVIRKTTILASKPEFKMSSGVVKGGGRRILVVEDDQGLAEMYRLALERSGFAIQHVREMVTAIRALNHQIPAVILLDLMLPGIRGLELARYVRRDAESPNVPIVIVSALRDRDSVKSAMDAGADVFMGKPVDWKELTQVVGSLSSTTEVVNQQQTKRLRGTARLDAIPTEVRRDTIVMFIDNVREPVTLLIQPAITLGRQNTPNPTRPHVDLDAYDAFDKGVGRVHALIRRTGDVFEVEDLDSQNGTYINGEPQNPNSPQALKNGDELRLGNLRLRLYFLSETELPKR